MFGEASQRTGSPEYQSGKIYSFGGMDRISSPQLLETQPNNIFYFPFITTPLILGKNVIDDESGAINKRPGLEKYLDNPDGKPIQELLQFTSYSSNLDAQIRISGDKIYSYTYGTNQTWGSPIYTGSGNGGRWASAELNGYLYLCNGINDFIYYDGASFYKIANGAVSTTLSADLPPDIGSSPPTSISVASTTGFNMTTAFIQVGTSPMQDTTTVNFTNELIKYSGGTSTSFNLPQASGRNYNNTVPIGQIAQAVGSSDTTIYVFSNSGYSSSGNFQVDNEVISYTSITPSIAGSYASFNGCSRGQRGTTATTHAIGALFGAYWISGSDVWVYYGLPPTSPKVLFQFAGRLWAFNSSESGGSSHVWVSASNGDPTDSFNWIPSYLSQTTGNGTFTGTLDPASCINFYIDPENGQEITACKEVNSQLIVSKESSLYSVQLSSTGLPSNITKLSSQFGAPSIHGLTHLQNTLFEINGFGILQTNSSAPTLLSYQITDLVQGINADYYSSIFAAKYNWYVYFAVGSVTEAPWFGGKTYNNCVLVYNYLTSNWFIWTYPFEITCMAELYSAPDTNKNLSFYWGDNLGNTYTNAGYLSTNNPIYSDNGIDIPIEIKLRYFFFQEPATIKSFRKSTFITQNGSNGSVYYSGIGDTETGWKFLSKLEDNITRVNFPDKESLQYRGIAYDIVESSSSRFRFLGIEQEYELVFLN